MPHFPTYGRCNNQLTKVLVMSKDEVKVSRPGGIVLSSPDLVIESFSVMLGKVFCGSR